MRKGQRHTPETIEKLRRSTTEQAKNYSPERREIQRMAGQKGSSSRWKNLSTPGSHWSKYANRPYAVAARKNWVERNRDRVRESKRKTKLRRKSVIGSHTLDEWQKLVDIFDGMCISCMSTDYKGSLNVDHIIPIFRGGTDCIENIQPLCRSCNSKKRTNIIDYRNHAKLLMEVMKINDLKGKN
jgi:5-methylcytosine-specific restriction endonuclease McrA